MKKLFFPFLILSCLVGVAQVNTTGRADVPNMQARSMFYTGISGQPFLSTPGIVEGTPFFKDEWMKAFALLSAGERTVPFTGRINLLSGQVHYLTQDKQEFVSTSPITELFLTDTIADKRYHFVRFFAKNDTTSKGVWRQLLVADSILLYRMISKSLEEKNGYGVTASGKNIRTSERYMVQEGNKGAEFKKPKELIQLYPAYKVQLSRFIESHPAGAYASTDAQLTELVQYLNTLLK